MGVSASSQRAASDPDVARLLAGSDPLLAPVILAVTEDDRRDAVESILVVHARPLVEKIVARRRYADRLLRREEAEDILSIVTVRLVRRLQDVPFDRGAAIERLADFTATLTFNAIHDVLRQRFPQRARLKNRVRHVLLSDPRFRVWPSAAGTVCGLEAWPERTAMGGLPRHWSNGDREHPGDAIASLLAVAGGPLLVADVVGSLAEAWNVADEPAVAGEVPDAGASQVTRLESRQRLAALWREIQALPARQRAALLLNLRDADGANAIALFAMMGIASLAEVAAAIELPPERIARLWKDLPLDDRTIAAILGVTRQQVVNLRAAARQRLARRLEHHWNERRT